DKTVCFCWLLFTELIYMNFLISEKVLKMLEARYGSGKTEVVPLSRSVASTFVESRIAGNKKAP
ncbi:TPA: hypothetical protein ACK1JB_003944, partial [Morganella morganii]